MSLRFEKSVVCIIITNAAPPDTHHHTPTANQLIASDSGPRAKHADCSDSLATDRFRAHAAVKGYINYGEPRSLRLCFL